MDVGRDVKEEAVEFKEVRKLAAAKPEPPDESMAAKLMKARSVLMKRKGKKILGLIESKKRLLEQQQETVISPPEAASATNNSPSVLPPPAPTTTHHAPPPPPLPQSAISALLCSTASSSTILLLCSASSSSAGISTLPPSLLLLSVLLLQHALTNYIIQSLLCLSTKVLISCVWFICFLFFLVSAAVQKQVF